MDAVPGRIEPEATGSSHDHTYCQPCAEDGKRILPDAFCTVCKEFLCSTCARVHRNMKLTKSHVLQDKSSMPSSFHAESEDETFTETCQFHANEFIKYYCPNHEALLCGESVVDYKEHRSCEVKKISQLAKQYKEGAEYKSLKTGIVQMVSDIENYLSFIQANMKSVEEESLTNINELRKFRHEINQLLDKREKELLEEIDRKKREYETLLNEMKANCLDMKTATEKLKAELQAKEVNNNQLFVSGTRAIKELVGLQSSLDDIRRRGKVPHSKFSRDPATGQLLYSNTAIGRVDQVASDLADQQKQPQRPGESTSAVEQQGRQQQKEQQPRQLETLQQQQKHMQGVSQKGLLSAHLSSRADLSQAKFSRQPDISVNTSGDRSDCLLFNMTLLTGDRLVLVDQTNCSLKLVDTKNNKLVSQVKLPSKPWDLCHLPGDMAAVTLPLMKNIQFVSTQGNLTLQEVVEVDGQCYGIDFCDDNLIVSFSRPDKVVLMDMKGKVKKSVDKDSSGKPLFKYPNYLTVTRESRTPVIYVSDCGTNTITKLSISIEVLQSYQDPILKNKRGLAVVGDNQLLMCGWGSYNILLLDMLTGKITQLLGKEEGIEWPQSVAYCSLKKMLFVTCNYYGKPDLNNFVKVFNLV
ncbi:E3 ubiquitin-protein ligase TRIM33-like [Mya arenaria]|uniref:E3 ubiquitin-protein ligase TRIM33-like n=1 Tax=Mya arenaria TaxID=6604 RepID=UPI0022DFE61D|nr:E3 ubiquitin-protein ligase TRIM33-like [Mya arenaria]